MPFGAESDKTMDGQRVALVFWITIGLACLASVWVWLSQPDDDGVTRWARFCDWFVARYLTADRPIADMLLRQDGKAVPALGENSQERRSYAVEQDREPSGTPSLFPVPAVVERLERASDDELLTILAQLQTPEGDERFADSRIAKFIGGRIEDRVAQVRAVREKQAPQPAQPARAIPVRERGRSEHLLALDDAA